jgi:nucleoside-diphosphate-sugar epimerase
VLISTGQVYLVREDCRWPARESDYHGPLQPEPTDSKDREEWAYGVHKREAEDVLATAWAKSGFPSTRLRLPMVNGERDPWRRIESYLWRILDGGPILLPEGDPAGLRHVYSGDVVKTIMAILLQPATFGEAYNLAQDRAPTLAELLGLLANLLGAPIQMLPVSRHQLRDVGLEPEQISPFSTRWLSYLDPSKARVELGFRPEQLRTYLDKIVTSFLNHPPPEPPESYAQRPTELALAEVL